MITAERLQRLKQLFAEDGITLTDAKALQIGHWLIERVREVVTPVPLDKKELFTTIMKEEVAIRGSEPFVNLYEWRKKNVNSNKPSPLNDVSP